MNRVFSCWLHLIGLRTIMNFRSAQPYDSRQPLASLLGFCKESSEHRVISEDVLLDLLIR